MSLLQNSNAVTPSGGYTIDQSVRYDDASNGELNKTFSSAGNRKTWTLSFWIKRTKLGDADTVIFGAKEDSGNRAVAMRFVSTNTASCYMTGGTQGAGDWNEQATSRLFRDPAAWYHFVCVLDTTESTAADRYKIYVNGVRQTLSYSSIPALNDDGAINNNIEHTVGGEYSGNSSLEGYLAEMYFIDGTAYDADDFGETNEDTNQWIPKNAKNDLTFGTNGFFLKFEDSSDFGNDSSGNGNDFTSSGLGATDQVLDSPTNNFATLNVLIPLVPTGSATTISEGNLKEVFPTGWASGFTWVVESGKFYCEYLLVAMTTSSSKVGIISVNENLGISNPQDRSKGLWYDALGTKRDGTTTTAYGDAYTAGDIVGVALDKDGDTLTFYKNGSSQGELDLTSFNVGTDSVYIGAACNECTVVWNFGQDSSFAGEKTAQGNGGAREDFYYTPPTGYLALSTDNLADPSIALPGEHFNTVLYAGNDTARDITTSFQPDLVWLKNRDGGYNHIWQDVVRGFATDTKLSSNDTWASSNANLSSNYGYISAADSDSFSLATTSGWGQVNSSGDDFVSWYWKAGGAGSANTDGSTSSTVSVNTTAGFSIVKYIGTGANATVGHGLSQAPELIIQKNRDEAQPWWVYSSTIGAGGQLRLDDSDAAGADGPVLWNSTAPTSSVFSVGTNTGINGNLDNCIAYCFNFVEGYSKFGSYTGNNNADGAFIYTGFKPAWVMCKSSGTGGTNYDWVMYDSARSPYNAVANVLEANQSQAEISGSGRGIPIDFLSNGLKMRESYAENNSATTYIYVAFAQDPFKTANAR